RSHAPSRITQSPDNDRRMPIVNSMKKQRHDGRQVDSARIRTDRIIAKAPDGRTSSNGQAQRSRPDRALALGSRPARHPIRHRDLGRMDETARGHSRWISPTRRSAERDRLLYWDLAGSGGRPETTSGRDRPPRPRRNMTSDKALRWGILGCARITRRGLVPGIRASGTGTLHALASRDPATARAWAAEFGVPRAHETYEALIEHPHVHAVSPPLPNELHRPWVTAGADAGKHILGEKPLALDAREAAAMVEHCRDRRVLLMEAFMWRHQPRTLELRRLIRDGAIGELRL